jgi:hypothetical protein
MQPEPDPKTGIIGYKELTEALNLARENSFTPDMVFDLERSEWNPETDTLELRSDCHPDAPMRVRYSHGDETFETLLFRCSVCDCDVMKIRVGHSAAF